MLNAVLLGLMLALGGYQTVQSYLGQKRGLGLQEKDIKNQDLARMEQIKADKKMNLQKQSMTSKYMEEAEREAGKGRQMQLLQMAMQERQGNNAMLMNTMGSIGNDMAGSRPDPRYLTSLLQ
jgi:hypothetical protein